MLQINGSRYCEYCMEPLEGEVCLRPHPAAEPMPMALRPGTVLMQQYVIGAPLGRGGFGITYPAYDVTNRRKVAIKEYFPSSIAFREGSESCTVGVTENQKELFGTGAEKFYDEARLIAQFNGKKGIIDVYEFFYANNTAYYVMEYLEGVDLKKYVRSRGGRIGEAEALRIAEAVCGALTHVHSRGVLHRDISPDNIFMCRDGRVVLIDFGAARRVLSEQSQSLSVILKQSFAPLEQYQRKGNQGPWTDIYALGMTLYYCVTGTTPDDAASRLMEPALHYPPNVVLSPGFVQLIEHMTQVNAERRAQSSYEVIDLLAALRATGGMPFARLRGGLNDSLTSVPTRGVPVDNVPPRPYVIQPPVMLPPVAPAAPKKGLGAGRVIALLAGAVLVVLAAIFAVGEINKRSLPPDDDPLQTQTSYYTESEWSVYVTAGDVQFDFQNDYATLSRSGNVIFNMRFDGPENESIGVYYEIEFPDGTTEERTLAGAVFKGDEYCCGWYDDSRYSGESGIISVYIYDSTTDALLGTGWVEIAD